MENLESLNFPSSKSPLEDAVTVINDREFFKILKINLKSSLKFFKSTKKLLFLI